MAQVDKSSMYWLGYILAKFKYPIMLFLATSLWYIGMVENSKPIPWQIVNKQDVINFQKGNGEWVEICFEYSIEDKEVVHTLMEWDLQTIPGHLCGMDEYLNDSNKKSLKSKLNAKLSSEYQNGDHWNVRIDSVIYVKKQ